MALIDKLTAIGDAIRTKTGKSDTLTLEQMATEIEGIEMTEELPKAEESAFGIDSGGNEYGIRTEGTASLHNESTSRTFGYAFTAAEAFSIVGFRHKQSNSGKNKTLSLWNSSGTKVVGMMVKDDATDWIDYYFDTPIDVAAGETYTVSVYTYQPLCMRFDKTVFNPKLTNTAIRYYNTNAYPSGNAGNFFYFAFVDIIIKPVQAPLPDDYQITRTTMDDIAEEIQRITGETGKLSTAQIVTALQGINTSLQSKTVTPTNESQTVTADSGYYGLSSVTVEEISEDNEYVAEIINEKMEVVVNDTY